MLRLKLLATTMLQNPNYLSWINRHRAESKVRDKEELLESLGWIVIRVTKADLRGGGRALVRRLRAALARRGIAA